MGDMPLTLEQARSERRCRICGEPINTPVGEPDGWLDEEGRRYWPTSVILNFGKEFSHAACLRDCPALTTGFVAAANIESDTPITIGAAETISAAELATLRAKAAAWDRLATKLHQINNNPEKCNHEIVHDSGVEARDAVREFEADHPACPGAAGDGG